MKKSGRVCTEPPGSAFWATNDANGKESHARVAMPRPRNHVERIASERIGRETVTYVSNIYEYYVSYLHPSQPRTSVGPRRTTGGTRSSARSTSRSGPSFHRSISVGRTRCGRSEERRVGKG